MTTERESRILIAAKTLARSSSSELSAEDNRLMYTHGTVVGAFICGARWADQNPENQWISVKERLPEDSLPDLSDKELGRKTVKVIVLMMDGRIMETCRRIYHDHLWYWNIPIRMREQVTHWMPVPARPQE